MNTGILTRAGMLALLMALTGCATNAQVEDRGAILSAADARAMIRVEVTALPTPTATEDALVASAAN